VIIASGKLELIHLNELFNTELKSQENRVTVAGWLTECIGHLPTSGMRYETDELLFQVLAADPNRVRRLYIRRLAKPRKQA
jgi:CBS domain containing-hemolysin-like protein